MGSTVRQWTFYEWIKRLGAVFFFRWSLVYFSRNSIWFSFHCSNKNVTHILSLFTVTTASWYHGLLLLSSLHGTVCRCLHRPLNEFRSHYYRADSSIFSELEIIRIVNVCSARSWSLSPVDFIWMFRDHIFCDLYFRFAQIHKTRINRLTQWNFNGTDLVLFLSLSLFMCFVGWLLILFRREPGTGNNTSTVSISSLALFLSQHKTVRNNTKNCVFLIWNVRDCFTARWRQFAIVVFSSVT